MQQILQFSMFENLDSKYEAIMRDKIIINEWMKISPDMINKIKCKYINNIRTTK